MWRANDLDCSSGHAPRTNRVAHSFAPIECPVAYLDSQLADLQITKLNFMGFYKPLATVEVIPLPRFLKNAR